MATKDQLFADAAGGLGPVEFTSAVTGQTFHLLRFNGVQRAEWTKYDASVRDKDGVITDPGQHTARLLTMVICTPDGQRLLEAADIPTLLVKLPGALLEELFVEAVKVNLLTHWHLAEARRDFFARRASGSSTGSPGKPAPSPTPISPPSATDSALKD